MTLLPPDMPAWFADLVDRIGEHLPPDDAAAATTTLLDRGAELARQRGGEAWAALRTSLLTAFVRQAMAAAGPGEREVEPADWQRVVDVCERTCAALDSGVGLADAASAARAAAETVTSPAGRCAAWAAARAQAPNGHPAEIAIRAAEASHWADDATLTRPSAWQTIADDVLDLIERAMKP